MDSLIGFVTFPSSFLSVDRFRVVSSNRCAVSRSLSRSDLHLVWKRQSFLRNLPVTAKVPSLTFEELKMTNLFNSIVWLAVLFFVYPLALICAGWYIVLHPLSGVQCCSALEGICDCLLKVMQYPRECFEGFCQGSGFHCFGGCN